MSINATSSYKQHLSTEALHFYLLIIFIFTFPFDTFSGVSNVTFIVLGVNWLFFGAWQAKWARLRQSTWVLPFLIFYVWHLFGFTYSSNVASASFDLQHKLPVLLFPLIMTSFPRFSKRRFSILLGVFVAAMSLYGLICLGNALFKNYQHNALSAFVLDFYTYQNLAGLFEMDAVFMAMYCCLVFYILIYLIFTEGRQWHTWQKVLAAGGLVYMFLLIMLLASRMQILILLITLSLGTFYYLFRKQNPVRGILAGTFIIMLSFAAIWFNPVLKARFSKIFNTERYILLDKKEDHSLGQHWDGAKLRFAQWQCAADLIQRNWLWGVGNGDTQDELQKTYEDFKFYFASRYNSYNAHNQYLETWIGLGIFGLLSLLSIYFLPLAFAWKQEAYLMLAFMLLIVLSSLSESVLMRRQGLMFFMLFMSLFYQQFSQKK